MPANHPHTADTEDPPVKPVQPVQPIPRNQLDRSDGDQHSTGPSGPVTCGPAAPAPQRPEPVARGERTVSPDQMAVRQAVHQAPGQDGRDLAVLTGRVADELAVIDPAAGWVADTADTATSKRASLNGSRERRLVLRFERRRLRVAAVVPGTSGSWPSSAGSISVDPGRGPRVIAVEIGRRLLPGYEDKLAQAAKARVAAETDRDVRDAVTAQIARILGMPFASPDPHRSVTVRGHARTHVWVEATIAPGGRVDMNLRGLSGDEAATLLTCLAGRASAPGTDAPRQSP